MYSDDSDAWSVFFFFATCESCDFAALTLMAQILSLNFGAFSADRPVSSLLNKRLLPLSVSLSTLLGCCFCLKRSSAQTVVKSLSIYVLWCWRHFSCRQTLNLLRKEQFFYFGLLLAVVCKLAWKKIQKPVGCQVFRVSPHVTSVFSFFLHATQDAVGLRVWFCALCHLLSSPVCHQSARTLWLDLWSLE